MKESYEEKLENKFVMYKDAIKKHAYTCAMDQVEERYVPVEEFIAEQEKVQVCLDLTYCKIFYSYLQEFYPKIQLVNVKHENISQSTLTGLFIDWSHLSCL